MRIVAKFTGRNRDFRDWLRAGMPENVVFLAEHKKSRPVRGGRVKPSGPSIA